MKFGTDGVRGVANSELTAEFALRLGRAAARVLSTDGATSVVRHGRDRWRHACLHADARRRARRPDSPPRASTCVRLGVVPTPMVAFVAQRLGAMGAMVSASHNPYRDNGIKLFAAGGVEALRRHRSGDRAGTRRAATADRSTGRIAAGRSAPVVRAGSRCDRDYVDHVVAIADGRAARRRCGSSSTPPTVPRTRLARPVFERLGADVVVIGDDAERHEHQRRLRGDVPGRRGRGRPRPRCRPRHRPRRRRRPADRRRPHGPCRRR